MKNTNKSSVKTYSRVWRIWAWVVLCGIFACGVMAGAFVWEQKTRYTADSAVQAKLKPCEMREKALKENLAMDIKEYDPWAYESHLLNARVYDQLIKTGCDNNRAEYQSLRDAEQSVADVLKKLNNNEYIDNSASQEPCEVIEKNLFRRIDGNCTETWCYLRNAEIYSKMAEDGCDGNKATHAKKALDELQIADGVRLDEQNVDTAEIQRTVNTYKKLQMQNEARKYIQKMEKLVNPGVEFIMELQRVIEE